MTPTPQSTPSRPESPSIWLDSIDFADDATSEGRPAWEALARLRDLDIAAVGEDRWPEDLLEMEDLINDVMADDSAGFFGARLCIEGTAVILLAGTTHYGVGTLNAVGAGGRS